MSESEFAKWVREKEEPLDDQGQDNGCFFCVLVGVVLVIALAVKAIFDYLNP